MEVFFFSYTSYYDQHACSDKGPCRVFRHSHQIEQKKQPKTKKAKNEEQSILCVKANDQSEEDEDDQQKDRILENKQVFTVECVESTITILPLSEMIVLDFIWSTWRTDIFKRTNKQELINFGSWQSVRYACILLLQKNKSFTEKTNIGFLLSKCDILKFLTSHLFPWCEPTGHLQKAVTTWRWSKKKKRSDEDMRRPREQLRYLAERVREERWPEVNWGKFSKNCDIKMIPLNIRDKINKMKNPVQPQIVNPQFQTNPVDQDLAAEE